MKITKRVFAILLAVVMVLSLAACGGNSTTPERGATTVTGEAAGTSSDAGDRETITLTVYSQLANFNGEQQGWSAKVLLDKFNVKINIIPESDGVFDTRMESGNLGDIVVFGSTGTSYQRALKAGMLLDWNKYDLLDKYGTYLRDNMPMALQANRNLTSEITEGASDALYGFGHSVARSAENHDEFFYTWDIRWDLYKQLGYPVVKDLDDLIKLFEDMKEICPTDEVGNPTYALSLWPDWDGNMVMYVKSMATAYYGYDEFQFGVYDPETGTMHDALEENGPYLTCLKFFNKLYQKGLIDPNSMTQTYDGMSEKLKSGGVFFSIFNYAGSMAFNTDAHMEQGQYMYTMVPEEAVPLCYGMSVYGGNRVWTIGANTEYPELCMEIINWFSTPEGYMTINYGPKGVTWDYDENKNTYFTELGAKCHADNKTPMTGEYEGGTYHDGELQINNTIWSMNIVNPDSSGETFNCDFWKSVNSKVDYSIQQDWIDHTGYTSIHDYMEGLRYKVAPAITYNEPALSDDFDVTWKQVADCIVSYSWKAIYAKTDGEYDHLVGEMIKKANAYGYQECKDWSFAEAEKRHALEEETRGNK